MRRFSFGFKDRLKVVLEFQESKDYLPAISPSFSPEAALSVLLPKIDLGTISLYWEGFPIIKQDFVGKDAETIKVLIDRLNVLMSVESLTEKEK